MHMNGLIAFVVFGTCLIRISHFLVYKNVSLYQKKNQLIPKNISAYLLYLVLIRRVKHKPTIYRRKLILGFRNPFISCSHKKSKT